MSSSLPPEILDLIIDHLYDEPTTLRACCLVSKSWVPRTRIHLFDRINFFSSGPTLKSWIQAFPNPSNSPTHYTRSLHLLYFAVLIVLPWIHSFNHIVELGVASVGADHRQISFAQLRGLSPTLKCLRISYSLTPLSEVLDFICSFPLLEDLSLHYLTAIGDTDQWAAPPTSPKFTGSLFLDSSSSDIIHKLLDLPGGLHFSKITVVCPIGYSDLTKELVSKCSVTLESLSIEFYQVDTSMARIQPSINLSEAAVLKDVEFRLRNLDVRWINATLQTARSKNLRQITIHFNSAVHLSQTDKTTLLELQVLDHLLVRLWTTRSIRPVFTDEDKWGGAGSGLLGLKLMPELTSRGFYIPI